MRKFFIYITVILLSACATPKQKFNYEVSSMGVGLQGTTLLKAWGKGVTEKEAIESAKQNAVKVLIFKGVSGSTDTLPIVSDPNAEEKNKDYFQTFFAKDGKYLKFVTNTNSSIPPENRLRDGRFYKIAVVVSINRNLLIKELESAGIIRKFGI